MHRCKSCDKRLLIITGTFLNNSKGALSNANCAFLFRYYRSYIRGLYYF